MKDLQKIKEFFSKPVNEGNKEYFKPIIRKNKSNPNFLYVDILYPVGTGFTTALGSKTMLGQDKEEGAAKALAMGNAVAKKLQSKYDLEDIDVSDLENGKVEVFAVSDDFIKIDSPSLDEAKISHIVGGIPYKRTRKSKEDKIEIIQKLDEPTKIKLIKKFKEKNWEVNPNEKGGLTATKKLMLLPEEMNVNEAQEGEEVLGEVSPEYKPNRPAPKVGDLVGNTVQGFTFRVLSIEGDKMRVEDEKTGIKFMTNSDNMYPHSIKEAKKEDEYKMGGKMEMGGGIPNNYIGKTPNESRNSPINAYKVGDVLNLKDGETWKVIKLTSNGGVLAAPVGKTKDSYISIAIEFPINILKREVASLNEAQEQSLYKDWDQFEKPSKIKVYLNNGKTLEINPLRLKGGKRVYDTILQAFIDDRFDITNKVIQGMTNNLSEAQEEDKVDTITMDVPLFIRMLEYSREDAAEDMDLHDVTEKAISLGKERGILQMDDYDEIIGTTKKVNEVNLKQAKLSSAEYQKAKKLKDFKASDWKWNADEDLYTKVNEGELTEAYVPSNIKEFAKRKGVTSLVNKVAGWAEKVGKGIRGGTAIGYNYSTLILDMTYQGSEIRINTDNDTITLYDEPVDNFNAFQRVYIDGQDLNEARGSLKIEKQKDGKYYWTFTFKSGKVEEWPNGFNTSSEAQKDFMYRSKFLKENVAPNHNGRSGKYGSGYKPLEEKIAKALDKINEELCPAGKAYIKRRQAAGEKSSAYLSGRGVKVCKGQMSGKAKKK